MSFSNALLRSAVLATSLLSSYAFACSGSLHIEIEQSGVYSLDHAAIVAKQPLLSDCSIDELALTNKGKQVPIRVVDNGDGTFGAGDRIEWIGRQLHGPMSWFDAFSINNVYLLSASKEKNARLQEAVATSGTRAGLMRELHFEQDNLMIRLDQRQQKPGEEPDVWQWAKLTHVDPQPFASEFDLPDLDTRGSAVNVRLNFRGMSEIYKPYKSTEEKPDDHTIEIRINGQLLTTLGWDGRDEVIEAVTIPAAALKTRSNTLNLSIPKRPLPWDKEMQAVDVVMFNWMELRFPIRGDLDAGALPLEVIADGSAPQLDWRGTDAPILFGDDGVRRPGKSLGNGRYSFASAAKGVKLFPALEGKLAAPVALRAITSADWKSPEHGYDYLIVSHASLMESIQPLADFHEKRGLKVAVLDVQDVYDSFNFGITHPQGVRNLVQHAYNNWPEPRPRFLLLVGDASFDIRHDTYNDLAYAKFANNPHELLYPGHFSGIPGTSYDKVGEHTSSRNLIPTWQFPSPEGQSASDNWFGAINPDSYHPVVAVGRFPVVEPSDVTAIVNKTIDYMTKPQPGAWRRDVMFITDEEEYFKKASDEIADSIGSEGFFAEKIYASKQESNNLAHQSAIKDGINEGQLLVHFIGHGGRYIWRTGPPDITKNHDLFTLDDVSGLTNSGRLPMILSMTCYSAPFDNPTEDSIGERFLREADKGAVAIFAASWRNAPSTTFSKSLVKELLAPGATIGEGIVRAKGSIQDRVLIEMYNLLGDPAVVLKRPSNQAQLAFDTSGWSPSVTVNLPGSSFRGQVAINWLDEKGHKLSSTTYRAEQNRFRLTVPKFSDGKTVAAVRVFATDEISGNDATAGAEIKIDAQPYAPTWTWASLFAAKPKPKPWTEDTISRGSFDGDDTLGDETRTAKN